MRVRVFDVNGNGLLDGDTSAASLKSPLYLHFRRLRSGCDTEGLGVTDNPAGVFETEVTGKPGYFQPLTCRSTTTRPIFFRGGNGIGDRDHLLRRCDDLTLFDRTTFTCRPTIDGTKS
jgi:hypothetical protein